MYRKAKIKFYSKGELAELFGITERTLNNWIHSNERLTEELKQVGYNKNCILLNPKQVQLIFTHEDHPVEFVQKIKEYFKVEPQKISVQRLAQLYNVSLRSLYRILQKYGISGRLTTNKTGELFNKIGQPYEERNI